MIRVILTIVCLAFAASAEVHTLTLKQAVEIALKQNSDVLLSRLDEQRARAGIRIAKDPFTPKVYGGSGLAYTLGYPTSIDGSAPSIFQAKTDMAIFNRPKTFELAAARENARGSAIDVGAKSDDVAYRTASIFLDTRQVQRTVDSLDLEIKALEQVTALVKLRLDEGRELPIAVKRAELNVARVRQRQASAIADAEYSRESLAVVLGFPAGDEVKPEDEGLPAAALPESEQACIDAALQGNRDIRRLESQMQAKGFEIKAQRSQRYPQIDAVGQYALFAKYNYQDFFRKFSRNNAELGVSFKIPLLIGAASSGAEAQAEADLAKLRTRMNDVRNQLALETRKSFQDVKRAESAAEFAKLDLEVSREELNLLLTQLEEGRVTRQAVEMARMSEQEKWLAFSQAQHTVEKSKLSLMKQTGTLQAALR